MSFASAQRVLSALRDRGHEVAAIDLSAGRVTFSDEVRVLGGVEVSELIPEELRSEGREFRVIADLELSDFDIVFLALHGHPGEDGTVHAVLDLKGFKYTGSCFSARARTLDKHSAKQRLRMSGIDTPDWIVVRLGESIPNANDVGFPVVVKPRREGSTIGISLVQSAVELEIAVKRARVFCDDVIIERYIDGRELTVGVLNGTALAVGEILVPPLELLDYAKKYQVGRVRGRYFPRRFPLYCPRKSSAWRLPRTMLWNWVLIAALI